MGDESTRARRGAKDKNGKALTVKWLHDEAQHGWYWVSFDALLFGGSVNLENYVIRSDLVRFKRPRDRRTHVGQVTGFGIHDDGYREPLVTVLDLRTQENLEMDVEKVRPLHADWEGDPPSTMKLDLRLTQLIEEFDEHYPERHTEGEDVDYSHQRKELKLAIESYFGIGSDSRPLPGARSGQP